MTPTETSLRRLFAGYVRHHQNGTRMLRYMGAFGLVAYPVLYLLRYTKANPVYDDLWLRLLDAFLCFLLLRVYWPKSLERYYMQFSYVALIILLPFSMVFLALQNGGGSVAVANSMMAIFLMVLLTDWRNTIVTLVIGIGLAVLFYLAVDPTPEWPKDYVERLPVVLVGGIASSLIKRALEQTTAERTQLLERQQKESRVAVLQETIGFMAHELNTPLAAVRLSVGAVAEMYVSTKSDGPPYQDVFDVARPGQVMDLLRRAETRAVYCQGFVQRLMRSAYHVRYDGGPQALTATSLVSSLMENYPFDEGERDAVDVITVADFMLGGSRELFDMVLSTVVQNSFLALRDTSSPRVVIEIVGSSLSRSTGIIRVTDNGCGMSADLLAKLTKEFVPSGWANGVGGGMGLMFCQRVLEAHGGEVSVESMVGKGTTVTLNFGPPREDLADKAAPAMEQAAQSARAT